MPFVTVEIADNVAPPRSKVAPLRYNVLNLAVGLPKSNVSETVGNIVPETLVSPPIFKLPPMPTPPDTVNAPVVVEVDAVIFDIVNVVVVPVDDPLLPPPALPVYPVAPLPPPPLDTLLVIVGPVISNHADVTPSLV